MSRGVVVVDIATTTFEPPGRRDRNYPDMALTAGIGGAAADSIYTKADI